MDRFLLPTLQKQVINEPYSSVSSLSTVGSFILGFVVRVGGEKDTSGGLFHDQITMVIE